MSREFPRYPAYKDSGVEWLGEVPVGWSVHQLKYGYNVTLGKMLQSEQKNEEEVLFPYLRAANIQWGGTDLSDLKEMFFSPQERCKLALVEGDLLVSEGGDVGRSCLWKGEPPQCYIQNSVNRVRAIGEFSTGFACYWILTLKNNGYIDILCNKSTIAHFTAEKLQTVPVFFPSPLEQQTIASFLDHQTSRIDALINEQKRLIDLLQEKRKALISRAVTKGLDPNVPMKDSGVEWLGEVPEGWELSPIKKLANGTPSLFIDGDWIESKNLSDDGIRYITTGNVGEGIYKEQGYGFISEETFKQLKCTEVIPGDILISRLNYPIGRSCIVPNLVKRIVTSVDNVICRPSPGYEPRYIVYRFSASDYFNEISLLGSGATMQRISRSVLGNVRVAWPSLSEQRSIATFLDHQTSRIDALIAEADRAITLMQERRNALISAAVTGKIDVRGLNV